MYIYKVQKLKTIGSKSGKKKSNWEKSSQSNKLNERKIWQKKTPRGRKNLKKTITTVKILHHISGTV